MAFQIGNTESSRFFSFLLYFPFLSLSLSLSLSYEKTERPLANKLVNEYPLYRMCDVIVLTSIICHSSF